MGIDPLLHSIKLSSDHYQLIQDRAAQNRRSIGRELQCVLDDALAARPLVGTEVSPRFKKK